MGYKIIYGKCKSAKNKIIHRRKIMKSGTLKLSITVVMIVSILAWPKGRAWVKEVMLPGDNNVTKRALQGLVTDVGDGMALPDALQVFCGEILDNG